MTRYLLGLDTASAFAITKRRKDCNPVMRIGALSEVLAEKAALEESYRYQVALGLPVKAETTTRWAPVNEALSLGVFWRHLIRPRVSPLLRCYEQKGYLPQLLEVGRLIAPPRLARDKGTVGKQGGRVSRGMSRGAELSVTTRKRKANYCLNSGEHTVTYIDPTLMKGSDMTQSRAIPLLCSTELPERAVNKAMFALISAAIVPQVVL